jgi:hypothetical protein
MPTILKRNKRKGLVSIWPVNAAVMQPALCMGIEYIANADYPYSGTNFFIFEKLIKLY